MKCAGKCGVVTAAGAVSASRGHALRHSQPAPVDHVAWHAQALYARPRDAWALHSHARTGTLHAVTDDRSRCDWAAFDPLAIPSKRERPQLERWLDAISLGAGARVVDAGCGNGDVVRTLLQRGFGAVGLDINDAALARCRSELPRARFYACDIAAADFELDEAPFDAALCQLVFSIVGDAEDRQRVAHNARALLRPNGHFFASFSGVSDDLNAEYAALYARDLAETGTYGTYWSRDAEGVPLYRTHHFREHEIRELLEHAGFGDLAIESNVEASSRRPEQRARFYYATARRR